ncbi:MAG: HsdR family type I site-specific deoxyribonuclease [Bacillales bacterium]|jgi:type I restriction enzyme R subunit|nr:HsdR family type I site-specific deoxyribonuclease [Bacillales bacterium]
MSKFTEEQLEKAIISLFEQQGYEYSFGSTLHRKTKDILIIDDFNKYLDNRYSVLNLTNNERQKIIDEISYISSLPLFDGNRSTYNKITFGINLIRDNNETLHIDFIDFNNTNINIFRIVNQYELDDIEHRIPDMLVFINGIPISICEFKTAIKEDATIYNAWEQIHIRYTRGIPNTLKYCFVSMITDGANTKLGTIFTNYEFYYSWRKIEVDSLEEKGIASLISAIKGFYKKDRLLEILQDFIIYPDNASKDEFPILCRYPQFFATKKLLDNIRIHQRPKGDGKGGTYFGATGCGKTYTMLFLTKKLVQTNGDEFKSPTVLIIVDREDLDKQTTGRFESFKTYLRDNNVRSIDTREDLKETLSMSESGGVYITTVQKFTENTGLLSERNNIICISDEAHRTQINIGIKIKISVDKNEKVTDNKQKVLASKIEESYGFAKYLHDSFPQATYLGFTGTPIDETMKVFGDIVDQYTMKESVDDGITVHISYEPALARVIINNEQVKLINQYYEECKRLGANDYQVEESKKQMTAVEILLGHPDRLLKVAKDIINHYKTLSDNKPEITQKAMIVCSSRKIAFSLLKIIGQLEPEWMKKKKTINPSKYTKEELNKLDSIETIKLVATQGQDDEKDLFDVCGNSDYRKRLSEIFKDEKSNFKIAIVVDMWLTGFDIPSLAVMYIDKPIQQHALIQTISRVNRVFAGKDKGIIVDYIGFYQQMLIAMKKYGNIETMPIEQIDLAMGIFKNQLDLLDKLFNSFDSSKFFNGNPLERLICLNNAVEFAQVTKEIETRFMGLSKRLKSAYQIVAPTGDLSDDEIEKANYYFAIRSIIFKQTIGNTPDAEIMNKHVEEMITNAIQCSGIEIVEDISGGEDIFSDEFIKKIEEAQLPISKFNALVRLLKLAIKEYGKSNLIKALEFDERLKNVVDRYNNRDNLVFTSEVVFDFIEDLTAELTKLFSDLKDDKTSFEKLGITFQEKAFFDILIKVRDDHKFDYDDKKCLKLAKEIKKLVDDKSKYADFTTRDDTKNELARDLTIALYKNGYPPQWDKEIFEKILTQVENFKRFN